MVHKTSFKAVELLPGAFIQQHSTLPTILKKQGKVFDIVTDGKLSVGDEVCECFSTNIWVVDSIVKQRKAKGDWSGKSYEGQSPFWNKVEVLAKPTQK